MRTANRAKQGFANNKTIGRFCHVFLLLGTREELKFYNVTTSGSGFGLSPISPS